ncbi:MAG TPA: heme o synthase [Symbiobacteriaceae bacterium]|nr:heme o synthase [Symbiobacteriaceae bacterium]
MEKQAVRSGILAATGVSYLLVILGGAVHGGVLSGSMLAWDAYLGAHVVLMLSALAALRAGWRGLLDRRSPLLAGLFALPLLGAVSLAQPWLPAPLHPEVVAALVSTWLAVSVHIADGEGFASRLSFFRSQWQVPLYAALATYAVVLFGSYLKGLGPEAACAGWPVCTGPISSPVVLLHLVHRAAVALAGGLLVYTMSYIWRRHQHRPALLVLTGIAVVLYAADVALGAGAARGTLTALGGLAHLTSAIALIGTLVAISAVGFYAPSMPVLAGGSAEAVPGAGVGARPFRDVAKDYLALTKPRILYLLLITGFAAMWVAAGGMPDLGLTVVTLLGLGMSCGAANAINMWWDRDIDSVMHRTQKRPLPAGRLTPGQVLAFGVMTGALSFVLLAAAVNLLTAWLSLFGLLFYVVIYTMWLKRSTTQNIVIGGAAGAVPPLVGWAAVTGSLSWAAVIMFLVVFMWTPPHFWALALFRNDDYRRAGVPMLPVVKGEMHTKWQILFYSILMIPTTAALYWTGLVGKAYLWSTTALGASMVVCAVILLRERLPEKKWAVRTFIWSIFWLGLVFAAMMIDLRA